jgi:hypothetical protein
LEETPFQPKLKRRKSGAARKKAGGGPIIEKKFGKLISKGQKVFNEIAKRNKKKQSKKKLIPKNPLPGSKRAGGGLVGGQKKLDVNRDGKITGSDFKMLKMNKKKYGGKINYRMKGGQVVDAGYD